MKTKLAILAVLFALAGAPSAAPISFPEVSLLVRMRESETYLVQQLSQRRLLRALTPEQETKLKTEGASERLLQALREPAAILPEAEATAFENWSAEQKAALARRLAAEAAEREAEQARRAAIAAAWTKEQEERAARERTLAEAAAPDYASTSSYGGSYGYGGYGYISGGFACANGIYGNAHGAYGNVHGTYGNAHGTYGNAHGTYGNAHGTYGNAHGTYGNAHGTYGNAHGTYGNAHGTYGNAHGASHHPSTPGSVCVSRPGAPSFSSGSLQWNNGTATTHTSPGLSYYPLGSNGAAPPSGNGPPVTCAPGTHSAGGRFGR